MADDNEALKWAHDAFRGNELQNRYDLYRRYAAGDQDLTRVTPKYASVFGTMFQGFAYNRCNTVIDAIADRLQVERFNVEHGTDVEETAGDLWRRNRMDARAGEVHKAAFRDGDAYLVVWPESGTAMPNGKPFPEMWPQGVNTRVRVRYNVERPGLIDLAAKVITLLDGRQQMNLYFPDRIEKWVSQSKTKTLAPTSMDRYLVQGEPWPVRNEWGTVPVFHFANNAGTGELGRSELADVLDMQDSLNTSVANLLVAGELTAFTIKVLFGLDANDPATQEMLSRVEVGRAKMITLPTAPGEQKPSIDEFTSEDLMQLIATIELFDKLIARVSRVPVHHLQMTGDFPSGTALRLAEGPFTSKLEDRQTAFGNVWEDAMHLALRMTGVTDPGMLTTVWKSAAPVSDEDTAALALQWTAIGIPLETVLRDLMGKDEEEIAQIMADKDADAQRQQQFDAALTGIGGAADSGQNQDNAVSG